VRRGRRLGDALVGLSFAGSTTGCFQQVVQLAVDDRVATTGPEVMLQFEANAYDTRPKQWEETDHPNTVEAFHLSTLRAGETRVSQTIYGDSHRSVQVSPTAVQVWV
jgi:hypothetical protein